MSLNLFSLPRRGLLALSSVALLCVAAPSYAFADDEARRAILELRQQVKQMSEQNQQARLRLADEVDMLRQEVAQLRGKVEKLSWQTAQDAPPEDNAQPELSFADPQATVAFTGAMELYREGQYRQAANGFAAFLDAYPNTEHLNEIRFYEGSALYAAEDYQAAIQKLNTLVQSAPDSPQAPEALMLVASSQAQLNDFSGAQKTLQHIIQNYPNSEAAETANSRLQMLQ